MGNNANLAPDATPSLCESCGAPQFKDAGKGMLPVTHPLLAAHRRPFGLAPGGGGRPTGGRQKWQKWPLALLAMATLFLAEVSFRYIFTTGGSFGSSAAQAQARGGSIARRGTRRELADLFPSPQLRSLVMVACHSVYTGLDFTHPEDTSSWFLLDYQRDVPGQAHSFLEHIEMGVAHAAADPTAMLLFSGGKTRRAAGPRAEAMGYWLVAEANSWFGNTGVRDRAFTEEHARDSFENLLFSLCRFYELTGRYPESVTVVGYEFKRERFAELHRAALRWPHQQFGYVGTPALTPGAEQGEAATAAAFESDPYGCHGDLAKKRSTRNPFADGGYTGERCPHMAQLLTHCGPALFMGTLPWDSADQTP